MTRIAQNTKVAHAFIRSFMKAAEDPLLAGGLPAQPAPAPGIVNTLAGGLQKVLPRTLTQPVIGMGRSLRSAMQPAPPLPHERPFPVRAEEQTARTRQWVQTHPQIPRAVMGPPPTGPMSDAVDPRATFHIRQPIGLPSPPPDPDMALPQLQDPDQTAWQRRQPAQPRGYPGGHTLADMSLSGPRPAWFPRAPVVNTLPTQLRNAVDPGWHERELQAWHIAQAGDMQRQHVVDVARGKQQFLAAQREARRQPQRAMDAIAQQQMLATYHRIVQEDAKKYKDWNAYHNPPVAVNQYFLRRPDNGPDTTLNPDPWDTRRNLDDVDLDTRPPPVMHAPASMVVPARVRVEPPAPRWSTMWSRQQPRVREDLQPRDQPHNVELRQWVQQHAAKPGLP